MKINAIAKWLYSCLSHVCAYCCPLVGNVDLDAHAMGATQISTARGMVERNIAYQQLDDAQKLHAYKREQANRTANPNSFLGQFNARRNDRKL